MFVVSVVVITKCMFDLDYCGANRSQIHIELVLRGNVTMRTKCMAGRFLANGVQQKLFPQV